MPAILTKELRFPDPHSISAAGLGAVGGDFSAARLLLAYKTGYFPWTDNPITWWSPDPRAVLEFKDFRINRSLAKVIRKQPFQITTDSAFMAVMRGCAAPAPNRGPTWISESFVEAYTRLHEMGHAHSVECWRDGVLVGGLYGVSIGGLFAAESMFHTESNASKIALHHLVDHLQRRRAMLLDIQALTPITRELGGSNIPRRSYLERLADAIAKPPGF